METPRNDTPHLPASAPLSPDSKQALVLKKKRDNPHSDRFIEVGTKALRRETDVWGDAAGTAPAVTSVTSLSPSIYFQSTINGRAIRCALFFVSGAHQPVDLREALQQAAESLWREAAWQTPNEAMV